MQSSKRQTSRKEKIHACFVATGHCIKQWCSAMDILTLHRCSYKILVYNSELLLNTNINEKSADIWRTRLSSRMQWCEPLIITMVDNTRNGIHDCLFKYINEHNNPKYMYVYAYIPSLMLFAKQQ